MILDLFTRCVLISLLAFGGGGAALPLIERIAVAETGWVSAQDFATAVAFGVSSVGFASGAGAGVGSPLGAGADGGVCATGEARISLWAVIPSSARGLNAFAANGGTASSETTSAATPRRASAWFAACRCSRVSTGGTRVRL